MLTGSTRAKPRREALAGLADGSIDLVVGTHAVISDAVTFHKLGLGVVDEQHRCEMHSVSCWLPLLHDSAVSAEAV